MGIKSIVMYVLRWKEKNFIVIKIFWQLDANSLMECLAVRIEGNFIS